MFQNIQLNVETFSMVWTWQAEPGYGLAMRPWGAWALTCGEWLMFRWGLGPDLWGRTDVQQTQKTNQSH